MLCINGRISWLYVWGILFSTVVILLTDIIWRLVEISYLEIVLPGMLILLAGNAIIFVASSRSGRAEPTTPKPS